jgi:hypothetical protein
MRLGLHLGALWGGIRIAQRALAGAANRNRLISVAKSEYRKLHIILE